MSIMTCDKHGNWDSDKWTECPRCELDASRTPGLILSPAQSDAPAATPRTDALEKELRYAGSDAAIIARDARAKPYDQAMAANTARFNAYAAAILFARQLESELMAAKQDSYSSRADVRATAAEARAERAERELAAASAAVEEMRRERDELRDQCAEYAGALDNAQAHCDRLTGMRFSDRMHAALVSRAEQAEQSVTRLKQELGEARACIRDVNQSGFYGQWLKKHAAAIAQSQEVNRE